MSNASSRPPGTPAAMDLIAFERVLDNRVFQQHSTIGSLLSSAGVSTYKTRTAAIAATVDDATDAIKTDGYTTAGDGGGALYKRVASEPTHAGKIQSADLAWWEIAEAELNVKMFGAKGDSITDDTAAIQNAIDTIEVFGGGVGVIPKGIFLVTSTLTVDDHNVHLVGEGGIGGPSNHSNWRQFAASTLKWNGVDGGGPVLLFKTPAGSERVLQNCDISGVLVDCVSPNGAAHAGKGIEILTMQGGVFRDVTVYRASSRCWNIDIGTAADLASMIDPTDTQNNIFLRCTGWAILAALGPADAWVLGADNVMDPAAVGPDGNVSLNNFIHCQAGQHDGIGWKLIGCDSNVWHGVRSYQQPSGTTGWGMEFHSGPTANQRARANVINGYLGSGHIRTVAGAVVQSGNIINGLTFENGATISGDIGYISTTGIQQLSGPDPRVDFLETDATANNRHWRMRPVAEDFIFQAINDAGAGGAKRLTLQRTAAAIDSMTLEGGMNLIMGTGGTVMFGADTVIDASRHIRPRAYTFASLPSASPAGQQILVSDRSYRPATSDGTSWRFADGTVVA